MLPHIHVIIFAFLVKDYFSFCGEIRELTIKELEDESREALVVFESESGASTACLITGAMIDGQSITVEMISDPLTADKPVPPPKPEGAKGFVEEGKHVAEKMSRSIKSVDEQYGISVGAKSVFTASVAKAKEIDEKMHITEKASAATQAAREKASKLNEDYEISKKMSAMGSKVASLFGYQGQSNGRTSRSPSSSAATG